MDARTAMLIHAALCLDGWRHQHPERPPPPEEWVEEAVYAAVAVASLPPSAERFEQQARLREFIGKLPSSFVEMLFPAKGA